MVTMKEIARLSGYSRTTVSAVLSRKPGISERATRKILEIVERYNYRPSLIASTLVGKSSSLIGVVVRDMMNPWYAGLARGIESVISETGFNLLFFSTNEDPVREVQAIQTMAAYQVDGLILGPVLTNPDHEHIWLFIRNKRPLICLNRIPGLDVDFITFQNEQTGWLVADYLHEIGHRNIAYLCGNPGSHVCEERLRGFMIGLTNQRLDFDPARIAVPCGATSQQGYETALHVLKRPSRERPTALFCFNDQVAVGVYKAAHELGLRIPNELSVVGVDDIEIASMLGPPLTTVSFSIHEVGRFVAKELLARIRNEHATGRLDRVFTPTLVKRGSTAPIGRPA